MTWNLIDGISVSQDSSREEIRKKVLYDAVLREKLPDLESLVELCDEEGHVIARIVPAPDPSWYEDEPKMNAEELK